jgi:hypothetical protein
MNRWLVVLALCALSACAAPPPPAPKPYAGQDAGYLITSIEVISEAGYKHFTLFGRPSPSSYALTFRQGDHVQPFTLGHLHRYSKETRDFGDDAHDGEIYVVRLPPGPYEIYNFTVDWAAPDGAIYRPSSNKYVHAEEDFSIPFSIKAGQSTYLGSFGAVATSERFLGAPKPTGAKFWVRDQSERDIPIARSKVPELPPIVVQIPDVDSLHNDVFVSRSPPENQ